MKRRYGCFAFLLLFSLVAANSLWGHPDDDGMGTPTLTLGSSRSAYFPLEVGNLWVYEAGATRCCTPLIVEVVDSADFNDTTYFLLRGFPSTQGDYWVRINEDGSLVAYDFDQNQENLWYAFQAPEGQPFETAVPFAMGLAAVVSRNVNYQGPLGEFDNVLQMGYPRVFQVGISGEIFVPDIGLVRRTENTGGPSVGTYELVYARLGGVTIRSDQVKSGITGHIVLGPTCPVAGPPNCADKPYKTDVIVKTEDGSQEVTRFSSNSAGYFHVPLPPGSYRLESASQGWPFFKPVSVSVEPNKFTTVTLMFDTGIR
jgi:hypothetical protein